MLVLRGRVCIWMCLCLRARLLLLSVKYALFPKVHFMLENLIWEIFPIYTVLLHRTLLECYSNVFVIAIMTTTTIACLRRLPRHQWWCRCRWYCFSSYFFFIFVFLTHLQSFIQVLCVVLIYLYLCYNFVVVVIVIYCFTFYY